MSDSYVFIDTVQHGDHSIKGTKEEIQWIKESISSVMEVIHYEEFNEKFHKGHERLWMTADKLINEIKHMQQKNK